MIKNKKLSLSIITVMTKDFVMSLFSALVVLFISFESVSANQQEEKLIQQNIEASKSSTNQAMFVVHRIKCLNSNDQAALNACNKALSINPNVAALKNRKALLSYRPTPILKKQPVIKITKTPALTIKQVAKRAPVPKKVEVIKKTYSPPLKAVVKTKPTPKVKKIVKSDNKKLQVKEIPGMLVTHNRERARDKLPPLNWSLSLANYAQQWADNLAKNKNCQSQHRPRSKPVKYGENLFWASPVTSSNEKAFAQKISGQKVVQSWIAEKKYFNLRINQCFPGQQCGHYTQVIWKNTTQVGCGKAMCEDKSQIWVCNYTPAGNFPGRRPY